MSVFAAIRTACAEVARRARSVRIDEAGLGALAGRLAADPPAPAVLDPAHHFRGDGASTLAFVISLDAVNFGSGWFPLLRKRPGLSGYLSLARALAEHFEYHGAFQAGDLLAMREVDCARIFGQERAPPEIRQLMDLFRRAWNDLGALLLDRFGGRFEGPIAAAAGSAARLVEILTEMPFYRDVARYGDLEVPLYKRAQITAADLALAFRGAGPGRFEDLDELTVFADNLVPHVLRCEGALDYSRPLAERIEAEELLEPGGPEEIEIRAVGLHAVERLAARLRELGRPVSPRELDTRLWSRGQLPVFKARPRHRCRCVYY